MHGLFLIPLAGAAAMVYGWPFATDYDIFLHLKTGQLTLELGHILRHDIFTYTAAGHPDETHSWGSQVIFWLLFRAFGPAGLYALNFALVATVLSAVWSYVW